MTGSKYVGVEAEHGKRDAAPELTAQQIVENALKDPSVYRQMADRENHVWGNILPAIERADASQRDQEAAKQLRMGRVLASLPYIARTRKLTFEYGLSLGCGAGRLERQLLSQGVCKSFHGVDISNGAIADAERRAAELKLPCTYEVADINFAQLGEGKYDLIVAQTSLHHVLFLERVAYRAWRALTPDGYLWIHDFVGESQGQYAPKRLEIVNELLALLPEKHRRNAITGRTVKEVVTPKPGKLGSPFEKIRSGEIVPTFSQLFEIEWKAEFTAFQDLVAPPGTRASYLENEDTKTIMELLHLMEAICIREGIVKPVVGQYLMRPRKLDRQTPLLEIFPNERNWWNGPDPAVTP